MSPEILNRIARAEASLVHMPAGSGHESAIVAGVPCVRLNLDEPWATQAKAIEVPGPEAMEEVRRWLSARAATWTVTTRQAHLDAEVFAGLKPTVELSVQVLDGTPEEPATPLEFGTARDPEEYLAVYGAGLAPLVTASHLADPAYSYIVGRLDGEAVACGFVRTVENTAYIAGVTVRPDRRGRGFGTAISAFLARHAVAKRTRTVWLTSEAHLHRLYGPLGFRPIDTYTQLRNG